MRNAFLLSLLLPVLPCAASGCAHRPEPARDLAVLGGACEISAGPTVDVLGAVAHPGKYPLQGDTTLRGALLAAGGLTAPAWRGGARVTVNRCSRAVPVDLDAISGGQAEDPAMRPGDQVIVQEVF
jgi:hypothetical protein